MLSIETDRLILREMVQGDIEEMYRLDTNKQVHKFLGEGWMNKNIEDAKKNVESIITQYKERGIGRWAAIEKESGKFIGWSGLKLNTEYALNNIVNFYDIGYRLHPEFWGKGYATESSLAALEFGFNVLNLERINGITHIENEASHRILLKIGLSLDYEFYEEKEDLTLRWYHLDKIDYDKKMSGMRR